MLNLYSILGLSDVNCTIDDIKKAYKIQVNIHHPDHGGEPNQFQKVKQAYDILSDVNKRKQYDKTGYINDDSLKINDEVLIYIKHKLNSILPNKNNINIINKLINDVNIDKVNKLKAISILDQQYTSMTTIHKKFHKRNNSETSQPDIINQIFNQNLNEIKQYINQYIRQLEILDNALLILYDYTYV